MKTSIYKEKQLNMIVEDLIDDQIVAIATDTVMGFACRADSLSAYNNLRKLKGHRKNKPFPVMVSNLSQLEEVVKLTKRDLSLIEKWFPGAITFVFNKKESSKLVGLDNTVAIRIPDDKLILQIVNELGFPIFLTSANKSDEPTSKNANEVLKRFDGEISSILMRDAHGYEASTIIDATSLDLKIIREANISLNKVKESLEDE